ncbi:SDR family NAD(P)-dependent oxidoreductase [Streptomyces parvulus]|uniref:SDR family NAD(P)-dependent oxidoreductase n=1 Tax=Streptomyces parvulus TaxID=146923 RepID=A0A369V0R5_9ACTN|nr:SDR family NAD(P)-dependent oxidoreductase [Streptomyces parvulus]RDD84159.1 SDR family NAD(P)-dependent oxidoreductase [Streptomyces parvulus]
MDLDLKGKRVLVTGASKGIGLAIVMAFRAEGAEVVGVSRRTTPELDATDATFVSADLKAPGAPQQMVEEVLKLDPRLDVLVNNVGGGVPTEETLADPFGGTAAVWADTFALNLNAAVETTRAALPALTSSRGAVVNISSQNARDPRRAPLSYSAAKAALNSFSRGLAEQVAASGVRVNVVTPSGTRTSALLDKEGFGAELAARMNLDQDEMLEMLPEHAGIVTGKLIDPSEIARAVVLLASPTMPSVIGSNWLVDGGAHKTI